MLPELTMFTKTMQMSFNNRKPASGECLTATFCKGGNQIWERVLKATQTPLAAAWGSTLRQLETLCSAQYLSLNPPKRLSNFITNAAFHHMPHKSFGSCSKSEIMVHLVVPNNRAWGTIPNLHLPHGVGKFHYGTIPNPTQIQKLFQQLFDFKLWLIATSCGMPLLSPW